MLFNKDRLSHWCIAPPLIWAAGFLLFYIPILHLLFGFSLIKLAVFAGAGCVGHLAVTPWLFSARPTTQNPTGKVGQIAAAVIVWFTGTALLFAFYLQYGEPVNPRNTQIRLFLFGAPIVLGLVSLAVVGAVLRLQRKG